MRTTPKAFLRCLLTVDVLVALAFGLGLGLALGLGPSRSAVAATGPWGWPLAGPHELARPFDPPTTRYGSGHRGVDLPSVEGAAVRAAGAGRVSYAGLLAGRGVVVVVHGALRTTYEPVRAAVSVGEVVALGAPLGQLEAGHLGCPVASCLHWGLRRGESYLDPVSLIVRAPVRLLPLGGEPGAAARAAARLPKAGRSEVGRSEVGRARAGADAGADAAGPAVVDVALRAEQRSLQLPLGLLAVAALMAGVGLLWRPEPRPPHPGSPANVTGPSTAAPSPDAGDDRAERDRTGPIGVKPPDPNQADPNQADPGSPDRCAPVVQLDRERQRRRLAS